MKIAKADLVPTDHNLRDEYADWQALEQACQEFMADVNTRPHRATREAPVVLLAQEHEHLHRLPRLPHTLCFGQTRKVDRQATVSVGDAIYSVPHALIGERVWVRAEGEQLVVVHVDQLQGPREVARHRLTTPGRPSIGDEHYPPRPAGALERRPRARISEEREFLQIGEGAERWLKRAAAEGTQRIRRKMAEAVDLAKLHGTGPVERRACSGARATAGSPTAIWPASSPTSSGQRGADPAPHARCGGALAAALDPQLGGIRAMNTPNPPLRPDDPTRAEACLRPSETLPRSDPLPATPSSTIAQIGGPAMTVKPPAPPPLPAELERLLRRLRMPYVRRAAPEVIATATSQRWEHAEVLRMLLAEEAAGRDQATIRMRRRASGLPAGKTFDAWEPERVRDPRPDPERATDAGMGRPRGGLGRVRPERKRQEPFHRSARAPRDRQRPHRLLAHTRLPRRPVPPPPRR